MINKKNTYSIRKLTIGAVSVLIGTTIFGLKSQSVSADTLNNSDLASRTVLDTRADSNAHADLNAQGVQSTQDASKSSAVSASSTAQDAPVYK